MTVCCSNKIVSSVYYSLSVVLCKQTVTYYSIFTCTQLTAVNLQLKSCAGGRHNIPPPPCKLTFDLLTLKVVSESCVTWATSMPILVFLGLSVLDLGPMHATD